jgi:hypothetical protein
LQGARIIAFLHQGLALGSSDAIPLTVPQCDARCCARISHDGGAGWCMLADLHAGDHEGLCIEEALNELKEASTPESRAAVAAYLDRSAKRRAGK